MKKSSKPKVRIKEVNLQGPDFILNFENPTDGYSEYPYFGNCNLYLSKTVNKGKYNERTEFKWVCSPTTKNALHKIILNRILNSENKVFKTIGDEGLALFYKRYKEEEKKLNELFNHTDEEWLEILQFDKKKKSYNAIL